MKMFLKLILLNIFLFTIKQQIFPRDYNNNYRPVNLKWIAGTSGGDPTDPDHIWDSGTEGDADRTPFAFGFNPDISETGTQAMAIWYETISTDSRKFKHATWNDVDGCTAAGTDPDIPNSTSASFLPRFAFNNDTTNTSVQAICVWHDGGSATQAPATGGGDDLCHYATWNKNDGWTAGTKGNGSGGGDHIAGSGETGDDSPQRSIFPAVAFNTDTSNTGTQAICLWQEFYSSENRVNTATWNSTNGWASQGFISAEPAENPRIAFNTDTSNTDTQAIIVWTGNEANKKTHYAYWNSINGWSASGTIANSGLSGDSGSAKIIFNTDTSNTGTQAICIWQEIGVGDVSPYASIKYATWNSVNGWSAGDSGGGADVDRIYNSGTEGQALFPESAFNPDTSNTGTQAICVWYERNVGDQGTFNRAVKYSTWNSTSGWTPGDSGGGTDVDRILNSGTEGDSTLAFISFNTDINSTGTKAICMWQEDNVESGNKATKYAIFGFDLEFSPCCDLFDINKKCNLRQLAEQVGIEISGCSLQELYDRVFN